MKAICLILMLAGWGAAAETESFTGVITNTMCGAHHTMLKNRSDAECVKLCTKGQYVYALYDGTEVIKLSDQKTPAKFAAQKVRITGTLNQKTRTIKVASIEPIGAQ
jgi:hypothetical protein